MRRSNLLQGTPILLVEDDMIQAIDLTNSFTDAGAIVIGPVSTLPEAFELARQDVCRVAVLNYRIGSGNTLPLAEELYRRGTPFVVHTGYSRVDGLPSHWPGCQLIFKPARIPGLIRTVAALERWSRWVGRSMRRKAAGPRPLLLR